MDKRKWMGLMIGITGFCQNGEAALCPKLTYTQAYDIFISATAENFRKEPTAFEKWIAFFTGTSAQETGPEVTFVVNTVQIEGQSYKMVSYDDISRLKDGGERTVFGGGGRPNRDLTSFSAYSDQFRKPHCAYALAYGPGMPNPGINMLRFELYLQSPQDE